MSERAAGQVSEWTSDRGGISVIMLFFFSSGPSASFSSATLIVVYIIRLNVMR